MKLFNFKDSVLAIMKPEEFNNNPIFQSEYKKDKDNFKKIYPFYSKANVTSNYFKNINAAGALTMLQKIENEVAIIENYLLEYFHNNTVFNFCGYTALSAMATQSTSYCKGGDTIDIYAGIVQFTSAPGSVITIDGKQIPLDVDGVAKYTIKASDAPGKHTVPITIRFIKPDGSEVTLSKKIKYEVAKQH
jgi:hypothetical protein